MSGWKTATIETKQNQEKLEGILNRIERNNERARKLKKDSFGIAGYDAPIKEKVEEILEEINASKVLIIEANDTTDSGAGFLYRVDQNKQGLGELVEEWEGYEGALANDVTGHFRDQHDIFGVNTIHY